MKFKKIFFSLYLILIFTATECSSINPKNVPSKTSVNTRNFSKLVLNNTTKDLICFGVVITTTILTSTTIVKIWEKFQKSPH